MHFRFDACTCGVYALAINSAERLESVMDDGFIEAQIGETSVEALRELPLAMTPQSPIHFARYFFPPTTQNLTT